MSNQSRTAISCSLVVLLTQAVSGHSIQNVAHHLGAMGRMRMRGATKVSWG
jgi:hypothetical protein